MTINRNWTVLFIGGASGIGKSSVAYELARYYGVNVLEVDDIHLSVKTVTTKEQFPVIHYWETGEDEKYAGVDGTVKWLIDVGKEMAPVLKALVDRHIEDHLPVIIEGDFIHPELAAAFDNPQVKFIFVLESEQQQIAQNYAAREGGELQSGRAEVSIAYSHWIADTCKRLGLDVIESRPWSTVLSRATKCLDGV
ncbi:hypothetical protein PA598K_06870 [Paenibacillus sp. 598K]|uniref:hypothetical protein n=1 Tax=Paenibacillus sp. 598K TaxID=1117987 RepID=UPI000FF94EC9|nr:hypothetical protein [Paenibacillus sp. 598K]GBF78252.1 hypothetical protein PA598K_06870 [Paenibacillus sp. 598K]